MRVPDDIKKCVAFVTYHGHDGETRLAGTAFFVGVDASSIESTFPYCVTARHVIAKIYEKSVDQMVILRINKKDGSVGEFETHYRDWQYHPDDSTVDVAVLAGGPDIEIFDVGLIGINIAVAQEMIEEKNIGVGDEVFITGLFANHYGEKRNLPIVRTGNVALMSDERVYSNIFGEMEAYLIESRSIGGLSGSPVFVQKSPITARGGQVFVNSLDHVSFWLGLIHGHWDVKITDTSKDEAIDSIPEAERVNMGIAIVVPSIKILEVINQPLFAMGRKRVVKQINDDRSLAPDDSDHPMSQQDFT